MSNKRYFQQFKLLWCSDFSYTVVLYLDIHDITPSDGEHHLKTQSMCTDRMTSSVLLHYTPNTMAVCSRVGITPRNLGLLTLLSFLWKCLQSPFRSYKCSLSTQPPFSSSTSCCPAFHSWHPVPGKMLFWALNKHI